MRKVESGELQKPRGLELLHPFTIFRDRKDDSSQNLDSYHLQSSHLREIRCDTGNLHPTTHHGQAYSLQQ